MSEASGSLNFGVVRALLCVWENNRAGLAHMKRQLVMAVFVFVVALAVAAFVPTPLI
jgi:hypothetical protein